MDGKEEEGKRKGGRGEKGKERKKKEGSEERRKGRGERGKGKGKVKEATKRSRSLRPVTSIMGSPIASSATAPTNTQSGSPSLSRRTNTVISTAIDARKNSAATRIGFAPRRAAAAPEENLGASAARAPRAHARERHLSKRAVPRRGDTTGHCLGQEVGRPPTIRVNGDLAGLDMGPLKPEDLKLLAEQIMTPRQVKEFAEKKEADFAIGVPGVGRFRTNIYQQRGTLAFAFRAIPYEVKTIRELQLPEVLEEIAIRPRGLVLVTGVTGSGKSTSLAAMINHVNQNRRVNIITIEDPIEFLHRDVMANISQREVGSVTLTFGTALRQVLPQDPDVILISEISDMETLTTVLPPATTGYCVFSTLPTTDGSPTLQRLYSLYHTLRLQLLL